MKWLNARFLIWVYFWLIIFEGVLRKWLFPSLSSVLLFVRDPVVLLIYLFAFYERRFPLHSWMLCIIAMGVLGSLFTVISGNFHPVVTLFGIRANFLHLPLLFIIPRYWNLEDIKRLGRVTLWLLVPMAFLMVLQFLSSPNDWINHAAGGEPGQMEGAMGHIRPPGYFTFITGAAQFLGLGASFLLAEYFAVNQKRRWLLWVASSALLICLSVSISRMALGSVGLVLSTIIIIYVYDRGHTTRRLMRFILPILLMLIALAQFSVLDEGHQAFESRLKRTGDWDAGVSGAASNWYERIFSDMAGGLEAMKITDFWGDGLGMGTNAAAQVLTGRLQFLAFEGEWGRVVFELGWVLGPVFILFRVFLTIRLLKIAIQSIKVANFYPIFLWGSGFIMLLNGQWGQSTTLSFAVFICGCSLAANRIPKSVGANKTSIQ
jgi:hypothetical protein